MPPAWRGLFLLWLPACLGGAEREDGDEDEDGAVEDTRHDDDEEPTGSFTHAYTSYIGSESYVFAYAQEAPGDFSCRLQWDAIGTPIDLGFNCTDCAFAFEVELAYDPGSSVDDGACADLATDLRFDYIYDRSYGGFGPMLLARGDQGYFYPVAYADFDGMRFTYSGGYVDYYYNTPYGYYPQYSGLYFTKSNYGSAIVR